MASQHQELVKRHRLYHPLSTQPTWSGGLVVTWSTFSSFLALAICSVMSMRWRRNMPLKSPSLFTIWPFTCTLHGNRRVLIDVSSCTQHVLDAVRPASTLHLLCPETEARNSLAG